MYIYMYISVPHCCSFQFFVSAIKFLISVCFAKTVYCEAELVGHGIPWGKLLLRWGHTPIDDSLLLLRWGYTPRAPKMLCCCC